MKHLTKNRPFIVLLVIFVITSALLLFRLLQLNNFVAVSNSPPKTFIDQGKQVLPTVIPTIIMKDWVLFGKDKPGSFYTLYYPQNWTYIGKSEGCGPVFAPTSNLTNSSWITICGPYVNADETAEKLADRSLGSSRTLITREQITVDNHLGIKQVIKDGSNYAIEIYIDQVKADTDWVGTLGIYIYNHEGSEVSKYQTIYDQIISSIRFTL